MRTGRKFDIVWTVAIATVAQLVEHLICNEAVRGSNPLGGSNEKVYFV